MGTCGSYNTQAKAHLGARQWEAYFKNGRSNLWKHYHYSLCTMYLLIHSFSQADDWVFICWLLFPFQYIYQIIPTAQNISSGSAYNFHVFLCFIPTRFLEITQNISNFEIIWVEPTVKALVLLSRHARIWEYFSMRMKTFMPNNVVCVYPPHKTAWWWNNYFCPLWIITRSLHLVLFAKTGTNCSHYCGLP